MAENKDALHGHFLLNHLRRSKKLRPLMLLATVLLSIIVVSLHAIGGIVLLKTGLAGFSLHNPIAYVLIGLSLVVAVFKLKHAVGGVHRRQVGARKVRRE